MQNLFDNLDLLYKEYKDAKEFNENLKKFYNDFLEKMMTVSPIFSNKGYFKFDNSKEMSQISFKEYIMNFNKEFFNILSRLQADSFRAQERESFYLTQIKALESKIIELGTISSIDFAFLITVFLQSLQVKKLNGDNIFIVKNPNVLGSIIIKLGVGPIHLFVPYENGIQYNPVLDSILDEKIVNFLEYFISMRDIFSANNVYDENGKLIDTIGFGIVDAYESYMEEAKGRK